MAIGAVLLAATAAAAAERSAAIRVYVRAAEGAIAGVGESVRDVKGALAEADAVPLLLDATMSDADVVLVLNNRYTGLPPIHARGSDVNSARLFYNVYGIIIDARQKPHQVIGRGIVWSQAATDLLKGVETYAREQQHVLLRRRSDWPRVGVEFEPLTKELQRELGVKGGEVVVTAVTPDGLAAQAGLQVGDALVKLGGRKVEAAGELARAIYEAPPGTALQLEIARSGTRRPATLSLP